MIINEIIETVLKSPVFNMTLQYLNKLNPPHWFICAGYIQQSYFNYVHGYDLEGYIKDIDVAYFDPLDISENSEIEIQQDLPKDQYNRMVATTKVCNLNEQPQSLL